MTSDTGGQVIVGLEAGNREQRAWVQIPTKHFPPDNGIIKPCSNWGGFLFINSLMLSYFRIFGHLLYLPLNSHLLCVVQEGKYPQLGMRECGLTLGLSRVYSWVRMSIGSPLEKEGYREHFRILFGVRNALPEDRGGVGMWREVLRRSPGEIETILEDFAEEASSELGLVGKGDFCRWRRSFQGDIA